MGLSNWWPTAACGSQRIKSQPAGSHLDATTAPTAVAPGSSGSPSPPLYSVGQCSERWPQEPTTRVVQKEDRGEYVGGGQLAANTKGEVLRASQTVHALAHEHRPQLLKSWAALV